VAFAAKSRGHLRPRDALVLGASSMAWRAAGSSGRRGRTAIRRRLPMTCQSSGRRSAPAGKLGSSRSDRSRRCPRTPRPRPRVGREGRRSGSRIGMAPSIDQLHRATPVRDSLMRPSVTPTQRAARIPWAKIFSLCQCPRCSETSFGSFATLSAGQYGSNHPEADMVSESGFASDNCAVALNSRIGFQIGVVIDRGRAPTTSGNPPLHGVQRGGRQQR
jgi:hypothetical protein